MLSYDRLRVEVSLYSRNIFVCGFGWLAFISTV